VFPRGHPGVWCCWRAHTTAQWCGRLDRRTFAPPYSTKASTWCRFPWDFPSGRASSSWHPRGRCQAPLLKVKRTPVLIARRVPYGYPALGFVGTFPIGLRDVGKALIHDFCDRKAPAVPDRQDPQREARNQRSRCHRDDGQLHHVPDHHDGCGYQCGDGV